MRILFAENHLVFAETVTAEFLLDDDVVIAPSAKQAFECFTEGHPFDAVLVDFDLDGGSGTDLVARLRESEYDGLIVATSAKDEGNTELIRMGADVACNKLRFSSLRSLLKVLLRPVALETPNLERAAISLEGLSVGDAFGECFFGPEDWADGQIRSRTLAPSPWVYTDDTEMAIAITEQLAERGQIDQSALARAFVRRFAAEPDRGYGSGAVRLLQEFRQGIPWQQASSALFDGQGSMGNGGAMRAAPIGAFFAEDLLSVVREARTSAAVTHAHIEGQAGAVAVAAAAACVWRNKTRPNASGSHRFLPFVARLCPPGATRDGLLSAANLPDSTPPTEAAAVLGCGEKLLSADTVPFALWCAERNVNEFEQALWTTVEGLGDRDTTCAMVGGIVSATSPPPPRWVNAREPLRFEKPLASGRRSELRQRAQAWLWSLRAGKRK